VSFYTNQENTINIRVNHEALELMGLPETYRAFSDFYERNTLKVAVIDFSELNHVSDEELVSMGQFFNVLSILGIDIRKINISPMLSRSIASRSINESNQVLWKK
jgi:anti-anti-sigma regulatory factor